MDLKQLIERLLSSGEVDAIRTNPRAQFGRPNRQYLGATLLPERETANEFTEDQIRFRTVIANDGDRYSPAQKKGTGGQFRTMEITLGDSDIAREFTGRDYDGMLRLFNNNMSMQAAAAILGWLDVEVNLALVELNEKQRWDAIDDCMVERKGDNGYYEPVYYANPAGHRINTGGDWADPTYDPWPDIVAMATFLRLKGFRVNRIVWSTAIEAIISANPKIGQRITGQTLIVAPGGSITTMTTGQVINADQIGALFRANRLPAPEVYDEFYYDQVASHRFSDGASMYFFCTTGRDERIVTAQDLMLVPDTIGYEAIGTPVGHSQRGRVFNLEAYSNKPPRIEGEGWQTSLPVILEPEAIGVIQNIGT